MMLKDTVPDLGEGMMLKGSLPDYGEGMMLHCT